MTTEKKLLTKLRENSRQSFAKISRELNISNSTTIEKYQKIKPLIIKHTTLANFSRFRQPIKTLMSITPIDQEETIKWLSKRTELNNLYKTANKNLLAETIFQTLKHKQEFIEEINQQGILIMEEYYIIEELKREETII
ncbi:MAG: hypothetical protein KKF89_06130 [Nanoarchaeota archaeon]|nr:hypothetical protein [Nanoarchaeota archaeon]MBU1855277.1 hypothetical protein [Nanoarchaeota archaeon]